MGLSQVLYSMAVIELSYPGLEATTYELLISVSNSASTVSGILSTQLLWAVDANGCDSSKTTCTSNEVDISSEKAYEDTDGPERFSNYTFLLSNILIFSNYLVDALIDLLI